VGVIGALAGVIGAMMALEAIKLITGAGEALTGRLLIYDALSAETRTVRIGTDPACPVCGG
jgi:molybdopterin/thiamine biosynthesis adenylyltransferase